MMLKNELMWACTETCMTFLSLCRATPYTFGGMLMRSRSSSTALPAVHAENGCRAAVAREPCPIIDNSGTMDFMILNAEE